MKVVHNINKNNSLSITAKEPPEGTFDAERFARVFRANGKEVSAAQKLVLEQYVTCLLSWNAKVNLVSRKDEQNIWLRQILASTLFLANHEFAPHTRILDLGTGGGLPGIPIAILCPAVNVLLVDSIAKKIRAVNDMIAQLGLANVTAVCSRAEDLRGEEFAKKFDYVVVRAVASIAEIIGWSNHLLQRSPSASTPGVIPPGSIVLLKGGELDAEIGEARKRYAPRALTVEPMAARGLDEQELPDKKIVIIQP